MYRKASTFRVPLIALATVALTSCDVASKLTQCPTGTVSRDGRCQVACSSDADCVSGESCDVSSGACIATASMMPPNMMTPSATPPTIEMFAASKVRVMQGEAVRLNWRVKDAMTVEIEGVMSATTMLEGQYETDALHVDTTFTMVARADDNMSVSDAVTVEVVVDSMVSTPPSIVSFSADRATVAAGEKVNLIWQVQDATKIDIVGPGEMVMYSTADLDASFEVTPSQSTTYRLDAYGAGDALVSQDATITVGSAGAAPTISSFTGNPTQVNPGDRVDLEWRTIDGTWLEIEDDSDTIIFTSRDTSEVQSGSYAVYPQHPGSFEVTVGNDQGQARADVFITVGGGMHPPEGPVINRFDLWPSTWLGAGTTVTVDWDVGMASSVALYADGTHVPGAPTHLTATWSWSVTESQSIELRASDNQGNETSTWSFTQRLNSESEPNDSRAQAQALGEDGIEGYLSPGDDDWFTIDVPAGGFIWAETHDGNYGCQVDTKIEVYAPNRGVPILVDDSSGVAPCAAIHPDPHSPATNLAGGEYFIRVSADNNQSGPYTLEIQAQYASCGNGQVEPSEACDDGNTMGGDGCSPECFSENGPMGPGGGFRMVPASYNPLPTNAPAASLQPMTSGGDPHDEGYATLQLPFTFPFFGHNYDYVTVSTNGYISFDTPDMSWTPTTIAFPDRALPNAVIAPFWGDLKVETLDHSYPASIRSMAMNFGSNQGFIIEFANLTGSTHTNTSHVRLTAQVAFMEDGSFGIMYGEQRRAGFASIEVAAGAEDPSANWGMPILPCSPRCGVEAGGIPFNMRAEFGPAGP